MSRRIFRGKYVARMGNIGNYLKFEIENVSGQCHL